MGKDNTGRVLTVRLTIMDPDAAEWLWKAYPNPIHGVRIEAFSNGDMFSERDHFAKAACFYIREEGETTEEAIDAHFKSEGYKTVETALLNISPNNITPSSKWEIVDRRGNVYAQGKQNG